MHRDGKSAPPAGGAGRRRRGVEPGVTDGRATERGVDLLLHCLACAVRPHEQAPVLPAGLAAADWEQFAEAARRHRVRPLLHRALSRGTGAVAADAAVLAELRRHHLANVARSLQLGATLDEVTRLCEAHRIPVLPFKGPATSLPAYGDVAAREVGDLDLLVRRRDYGRAQALLRSRGWEPSADWGWESSFIDPGRTLVVDLHRSITAPQFRLPLGFEALHARRVALRIGDRVVAAPGPEDTLLLLCVQIVKDGWARRCTLARVCDVAGLLHRGSALDWQALLARARRLGCRRVVAVGLLLAKELLAAPVPAPLPQALLADPAAGRVARRIRADLLPPPTPSDEGLDDRLYYADARERWRDRALPAVERWLRLTLTPNGADRAFVRLPEALRFLYWGVRPIRVLRDRSRRLPGGTARGAGR